MQLCPAFYLATTVAGQPGHRGLLQVAYRPVTAWTALASAPAASSRLLGGLPGSAIFGLGVLAGALIVVAIRAWLWWRAPNRSAAALPASAPVSTTSASRAEPVIATAPPPASARPVQAYRPQLRDPAEIAKVSELVGQLGQAGVVLVPGSPPEADRLLLAAASKLAAGDAGERELVLVGYPGEIGGAVPVRCADVRSALDLVAARAVRAQRRLVGVASVADQAGVEALGPDPAEQHTVLVSRLAPTTSEAAMLTGLVREAGMIAALLPAPPQPATAEPIESAAAGRTTAARPPAAEPGPPPAAELAEPGEQPQSAGLRIGVLGQLTINGQPGALLPAQTQLILALALNQPGGLPGRQLCRLLGADAQHPKPADSLRQLIARTRRQPGAAPDGREWIEHRGHGQYGLHQDSRLDWHEFEAVTAGAVAAADASQLTAALSMIRGQPFTGCYYWWLDIELVEVVQARIVTAAATLAELSIASRQPAAAARAARTGLVADNAAEQLWRLLMRAEHAAGNLAGVRESWNRCIEAVTEIAIDGEPEAETVVLYHQLLDR
jgi:DNA-binding SARP family transcriptional activator